MTTPIRGLTQGTANRTAAPSDLRTGVVTAVAAGGLTVEAAGGTIEGAAHVASYNPAVGDPVAMIQFEDTWLVLGRPIGPGTATDYATAGPVVGASVLKGCVLNGTGGTIATSTGAVVVVPRYSVTYHHPADHWVMLTLAINWYCNTTNDWMRISVKNGATGVAVGAFELVQSGNNFFGNRATQSFMVPPDQGGAGRSYYVDIQRVNGTGTVRIDDPIDRLGFLMAYDLGGLSLISKV